MSQLISDARAGGGLITAVNGGNNITVNTIAGVATVNVSGTTNHAVQVGNALGALTSLALGNAGEVLTSNGPGLDPSFQPAGFGSLSFDGNTGTANPAANTIIFNTANATPIFAAAGNTLLLDFGLSNLVLGSSLPALVGGSQNSGLGDNVLNAIVSGVSNSGVGFQALQSVNSGSSNTGIGASAGSAITSGNSNTALGNEALEIATIGSENTALGDLALGLLTTASFNTAVGSGALDSLITGTSNTAIGINAGTNYTTTESSNLVLGNIGIVGDNNTIRIGQQGNGLGQQNLAFMAGIVGVTVSNAQVVTIDSTTGQLGVAAGGGTPISTITGNTGGAQSPAAGNFNFLTANSTVVFAGTPATETLNFGLSNLVLGSSLPSLTSGTLNVGLGQSSLNAITSGSSNVGIGYQSLLLTNSGSSNVALGQSALRAIASGNSNIGIGLSAGSVLATGSFNVILGSSSGSTYTTSESSNILLNSTGLIGESNTLRIGQSSGVGSQQLNRAFISGIDGVNLATANVVTMASDQLGSSVITAGANITVTPGVNLITIAATTPAAVATSYATDSGSAVPAANILTVAGGLNIDTSGAGSTVTIASSPDQYLANYRVANATPFTVNATDYYITVDTSTIAITIRLPDAPTIYRRFIIKDSSGNAATNNITVTTVGGLLNIDAATTFVMNTNWQAIQLVYDGFGYQVF